MFNSISRWTIARRITVGFTAITLIAVVMGVMAFLQLQEIHRQCSLVKKQALPAISRAGDLTETVYTIGAGNDDLLLKLLMSPDADLKKGFKAQLVKNQASLTKQIDTFGSSLTDAESKRLLVPLQASARNYTGLVTKIVELADADNQLDAMQLKQNDLAASFAPLTAAVHAEVAANRDAGDKAGDRIETAAGNADRIVLICFAGFAAVTPVAALIALGSTPRLKRMTTVLAETSTNLTAAAEQLAELGQALAEGSARQAVSLRETVTSLEQMTNLTRTGSESAGKAGDMFGQIQAAAERTVESMAEMRDAIEQIQDSASKTSNIVGTFDEISMQTRKLVLNASTEALKSGKDGRGFADVIKGIRDLAARTADSARDTKSLIKGNMESARTGFRLLMEVDSRLNTIQESVDNAGAMFTEITTASKQQNDGIGQMRHAVRGMSSVTEANAGSAKAFVSSAEVLKRQASSLQTAVLDLQMLAGRAKSAGTSKPAPPAAGKIPLAPAPLRLAA